MKKLIRKKLAALFGCVMLISLFTGCAGTQTGTAPASTPVEIQATVVPVSQELTPMIFESPVPSATPVARVDAETESMIRQIVTEMFDIYDALPLDNYVLYIRPDGIHVRNPEGSIDELFVQASDMSDHIAEKEYRFLMAGQIVDVDFNLHTYRISDSAELHSQPTPDVRCGEQTSVSPDGKWCAYVFQRHIYVKQIPVSPTEEGISLDQPGLSPQWSSTGDWISFQKGMKTYLISTNCIGSSDDTCQPVLMEPFFEYQNEVALDFPWSNDGQKVMALLQSDAVYVAIYDLETGEVTILDIGAPLESAPAPGWFIGDQWIRAIQRSENGEVEWKITSINGLGTFNLGADAWGEISTIP